MLNYLSQGIFLKLINFLFFFVSIFVFRDVKCSAILFKYISLFIKQNGLCGTHGLAEKLLMRNYWKIPCLCRKCNCHNYVKIAIRLYNWKYSIFGLETTQSGFVKVFDMPIDDINKVQVGDKFQKMLLVGQFVCLINYFWVFLCYIFWFFVNFFGRNMV